MNVSANGLEVSTTETFKLSNVRKWTPETNLRDSSDEPKSWKKKNFQIVGFAYVGGACVVNKRLEKVNSVAIIEDTGGFSGIIVAAHEVGHL